MRIRTIPTILILVALLGSGARAEIDAKTALKNMFEAERKVCFIGHEVTTITRGPALTSEQTVYRAGIKGMRMEFTSPDRLKGEVRADDGHVLAHYSPQRKELKLRPSRMEPMQSWMHHAGGMFGDGHLDAQIVGKDKVAGRTAYVVQINAHGREGSSRKVYIDTEKWVKLKTEEIAPGGTVVSMSYFTKIEFVSSIPDDKFHITPPPGVHIEREMRRPDSMSIADAKKQAGFTVLQPSYVPDGFKLAGAAIIPFREGKIVSLRYTDGVNAVSLFQTPGDRLSPRFLERLRQGPSRGGEVYTWQQGKMSLTIVGRIPMDQIRRMAQSIK